MDERIASYLKELCKQIRFRQAHERVRREYECHILDQRDALIARGIDREEATSLSIRQTGDAVELGAALDGVHRPRPQWRLLLLCLVILLLGQMLRKVLRTDFSITIPILLLGLALLCICYLADLRLMCEVGLGIYGLALVVYGVLMLQKFSAFASFAWDAVAMSSLWTLGLVFPLLYAALLYGLRGHSYRGMAQAQLAYVATLLLFALLPSILGLWLFGLCGLGLLFFAHSRRWFAPADGRGTLLLFGPILVSLCVISYLALIYNKHVQATVPPYFTDPSLVPRAVDDILNSTKLLGAGATLSDEGSFLLQFLQERTSLFTDPQLGMLCLAYRCGWLVASLVLFPMLVFLGMGFYQWSRLGNDLARFISLAVLVIISLQVGVYLLNNLGLISVEGVALPLLTGGNVGFILHMILVGFMLSCFRSGSAWAEGPPQWKWNLEHKKEVTSIKEEGNCEK